MIYPQNPQFHRCYESRGVHNLVGSRQSLRINFCFLKLKFMLTVAPQKYLEGVRFRNLNKALVSFVRFGAGSKAHVSMNKGIWNSHIRSILCFEIIFWKKLAFGKEIWIHVELDEERKVSRWKAKEVEKYILWVYVKEKSTMVNYSNKLVNFLSHHLVLFGSH